MIELKLPIHYVEFLLSYLDEEADIIKEVGEIREEIRLQTYDQLGNTCVCYPLPRYILCILGSR